MWDTTPSSNRGLPALDPALLAFIKCHVTSLARWHALRTLHDHRDQWLDVSSLGRRSGSAPEPVAQALAELAREGVVEETSGPLYRLSSDDPTATVLGRLIAALASSLEVRQLLVAHLRQTADPGSAFAAASGR